MKPLIPKSFWKLTRRWLFNIDQSAGSARRRPRLFKNSLRVAVIGLAMGVASLSLTLSLVRGVEHSLSEGLGRGIGHVTHNTRVWTSYSQLQQLVKKAPEGVVRAEFVWDSQALLLGPDAGRGVRVMGVLPSDFRTTDPYSGKFPLTIDLGKPLAEFLGVRPGQEVSLLLPGVVRGRVPVRVLNVVEFGYYEYDSRYARIDARGLYAYLKERQPDLYESRPGDAYAIRYYLDESRFPFMKTAKLENWKDEYQSNVEGLSKEFKLINDPKMWSELEFKNFFEAIRHDRVSLTLVLALLALVATLNVAATLLVLYLERDQDLAILVAIGLKPSQLRLWIAAQGFLLGFGSSMLGFVFAYVLSFVLPHIPAFELPPDIYNVSKLPFRFDALEQFGILIYGTFSGGLIAAFLAWRLSKTPILDVLRYRR